MHYLLVKKIQPVAHGLSLRAIWLSPHPHCGVCAVSSYATAYRVHPIEGTK